MLENILAQPFPLRLKLGAYHEFTMAAAGDELAS